MLYSGYLFFRHNQHFVNVPPVRGPRLLRELYFPAMVAARFNTQVKALYQRLLARGKLKMVALGAVSPHHLWRGPIRQAL